MLSSAYEEAAEQSGDVLADRQVCVHVAHGHPIFARVHDLLLVLL